MTNLTLFHFPGACSRVTMTALEHVGADYDDVLVDLMKGDHLTLEYLTTNPRGKVPALLVDGELLTENASILVWIDSHWPEAELLPPKDNKIKYAQILSDLFWLSSVWHPYVRANKMPMRWTTGDIAPVRERGRELLLPCVKQLETRLEAGTWWYGQNWSILDAYFYWAYTTAEEGKFSLSAFPCINRHREAIEALPALQRAKARENAVRAR